LSGGTAPSGVTHDLAEMVAEVLRLIAMREVFAERQEQIAVACLYNAAAIVASGRQRPVLPKNDL
jgi:hypothetical protein